MFIAPAATESTSAGQQVYRQHARDLFALPGVRSVGWSKQSPDEVRLSFATEGFRRLADNVLRDAVDGVRLVLSVEAGSPAPVPGGDSWADSPSEMARAIAGLPGVVDATSHHEHGIRTFIFSTYEAHVAARLRPLVNERLGAYGVQFWARSLPKPPAA